MPDFPVWMHFFSFTPSDRLSIDRCPNLWPLDPEAQLWNSLLPDEKEGWGVKKQWVSLFYQLQCFPGDVVREVQSLGKIRAEDLASASRISFLRWAVALLSKVRISHCFMWLYWVFFYVTHLIQGVSAEFSHGKCNHFLERVAAEHCWIQALSKIQREVGYLYGSQC